jgi:hypothetical protein
MFFPGSVPQRYFLKLLPYINRYGTQSAGAKKPTLNGAGAPSENPALSNTVPQLFKSLSSVDPQVISCLKNHKLQIRRLLLQG